jgi:hypothetical protein
MWAVMCVCRHMCHTQARSCLSTGWALNRCFAWGFGTAAVLAQGGGGVRCKSRPLAHEAGVVSVPFGWFGDEQTTTHDLQTGVILAPTADLVHVIPLYQLSSIVPVRLLWQGHLAGALALSNSCPSVPGALPFLYFCTHFQCCSAPSVAPVTRMWTLQACFREWLRWPS